MKYILTKKANIVRVVLIVTVVTLHHFSIEWMQESRSIEKLMANSGEQNLLTISAIIWFIGIRLFTLLCLPGIVLSWLGLDFLEYHRYKNERTTVNQMELK